MIVCRGFLGECFCCLPYMGVADLLSGFVFVVFFSSEVRMQ